MNVPLDPTTGIDASAEPAIDDRHPWLGLASFSEETRAFFYGRDEEVGELARRVQRKLLTVLFGQSGLGKTSILRAGIVPRLRAQGYCPVYVRIDYGPEAPAPAQQIRQAIAHSAAQAGYAVREVSSPDASLWEFLHRRDDVITGADGKPVIPLLIFDQFEEIFTLAQGNASGRERAARFVEELAELVENRPSRSLEARLDEDDSAFERFDFARSDYRVLITLREDYLAHLEGLKTDMPSITQNRMRLAPMTGSQALAAVTGPGGALVSEEVAEAIVRFVAGGTELIHAHVEPSLLSLICRELNDKRLAAGRSVISLDLLAGSHASILSDFYERALGDQPDAVRSVIEDLLLTDSGYRENVAEERVLRALADAGASPDALAVLVNRRLLRIEERLDVRRVELTHDVLCGVVAASRAQRQEREALASTARQQLAQDERERSTRRALTRSRRITAASLVLASVAVACAVFGYVNLQQARANRALAVSSRADAEKLVGYLLDDFQAELVPVGRLDMIGELASRTVAYYRALAPSMRTPDTEANYALALLRLGDVRWGEGKLDESAALLDQAIAMLQPLQARAKVPPAVALTLAEALTARSLVAFRAGNRPQATRLEASAVALARPLTLAPGGSLQARRVYANAVMRIGYMKMRDEDLAGAQVDLRTARSAVDVGSAVATDARTAIVYADATSWLAEATSRRGDHAGAVRLANEALAIAGRVLERRPNHVFAMDIMGRTQFNLGVQALEDRRPELALRALAASESIYETLLRIEPSNQSTIDYMAIDKGFQARAFAALGRPLDARRVADEAFALYAVKAPSAFQSLNMADFAAQMALVDAEQGQVDDMARMLALAKPNARPAPDAGTETFWDIVPLMVGQVVGNPAVIPAAVAVVLRRAQHDVAEAGKHDTARASEAENTLEIAGMVDARLAYADGDYVRAAASSRLALDAATRDGNPDTASMYTEHALALAQLGRLLEARQEVQQSIDRQRAIIAAGSDDQMLRLELAQSLYTLALTQADGGARPLKEATELLDRLPAAMQPYRTVRLWRERIADANTTHHPRRAPTGVSQAATDTSAAATP